MKIEKNCPPQTDSMYVCSSVLVLNYISKDLERVPVLSPLAGADPAAVLLRSCSRCIPQPNSATVVCGCALPRISVASHPLLPIVAVQ